MDHKLCKNCKGYCCDDFAVTVSPDKLEISYQRWLNSSNQDKEKSMDRTFRNCEGDVIYNGIHLTYPMLIFTHKDNIHPDGDVICKETVYHYRCKHHNVKTKMCDIHEIRPMVCRTFPNNGFCGYRKVKDKEVISYRPKWFELGLTHDEWLKRMNGKNDESIEDKQVKCESSEKMNVEEPVDYSVIKRLDNISEMLVELGKD